MKNQALLPKYLLASFLGMLFTVSLSAQQSKKVAKLEKRIQQVMELSNCPGMSVAVVEKGKVIYAKGFGFKDYENKKPVTANTLFAIGSCTKAFTGVLSGQLEEEGKLDLDESPIKYLPELSFYNSEMNEMIRMRDLLSHSTGLPRHDISWYMFPTESRDTLVARIQYQEPTLGVREEFQYNNFMYMLVGAVSEKVNEKNWEESIREKIFEPLEMTQTNMSIAELEKSEDYAFGYGVKADKTIYKDDYYHIRGMAPAGCINSSANDMGKWMVSWINGGKYQGEQVIPEKYASSAIGSQSISSRITAGGTHPDLHFSNYGFGWALSSYRGHYRVGHGGNINGFTASSSFFPTDSIGIVVLVNQNYSGVTSIVRNIIADKMLDLKSGKWDERLIKQSKTKKEETKEDEEEGEKTETVSNRIYGTQHSHDLEAYTGKFNHPGYGTLYVVLKNDSLIAQLPERKWWLKHNHYDVFEPFEMDKDGIDTTQNGGMVFNFKTNNSGEIDGFTLNVETGLDPIFFERQLVEVKLETSDLERYVADYDMNGTAASVFIKDEILRLLIPGQPEYTLIASGEHKFVIEDLEGYGLEFEEKEGEIKALLFIQPNGNFRVPRKD